MSPIIPDFTGSSAESLTNRRADKIPAQPGKRERVNKLRNLGAKSNNRSTRSSVNEAESIRFASGRSQDCDLNFWQRRAAIETRDEFRYPKSKLRTMVTRSRQANFATLLRCRLGRMRPCGQRRHPSSPSGLASSKRVDRMPMDLPETPCESHR